MTGVKSEAMQHDMTHFAMQAREDQSYVEELQRNWASMNGELKRLQGALSMACWDVCSDPLLRKQLCHGMLQATWSVSSR